jgi:energy-coupling factor transport system ATP-binding protein
MSDAVYYPDCRMIELPSQGWRRMNDLIRLENVTFTYPDRGDIRERNTLESISFTVKSGEYIAILGANGSGKSTLAKMINGLLLPDEGSVFIANLNTRQKQNISDIRKKVGMVFQSPEEQIFSSTIEEDVAFGLENYGWEYEQMHKRVREVLTHLDLWELRARPSYLLSAGQTQRLALAGVLAIQPDCIVFDEATSMLDPIGRQVVLGQMESLHQIGKTILHITHSMDEAARATRIIVLKLGKIVYDGSSNDLFSGQFPLADWNLEYPPQMRLIQQLREQFKDFPTGITTLEATAHWIKETGKTFQPTVRDPLDGESEIQVTGLGHIYLEDTPYQTRALLDADLTVTAGSSHGLIGVTGSGKSTLLQHLNGLLRPQRGTVQVGPYDLSDQKISRQKLVQYVGLVMQNPEVQFFEEYVGDEIAYGPKTVGIPEPIADRVRWAMNQVGLDFDQFKDRTISTLSGGEKRKAALASIIALRPRVLLLDEPTAGLDPVSHRQILEVFDRMQEEGVTFVVSSHNMDDIAHLCRSVTIMDHGRSAVTGPVREVLSDSTRLEALRMATPVELSLVNEINLVTMVSTESAL